MLLYAGPIVLTQRYGVQWWVGSSSSSSTSSTSSGSSSSSNSSNSSSTGWRARFNPRFPPFVLLCSLVGYLAVRPLLTAVLMPMPVPINAVTGCGGVGEGVGVGAPGFFAVYLAKGLLLKAVNVLVLGAPLFGDSGSDHNCHLGGAGAGALYAAYVHFSSAGAGAGAGRVGASLAPVELGQPAAGQSLGALLLLLCCFAFLLFRKVANF